MSKELKEFNRNWNAQINYRNELFADLEKNHSDLLEIFMKKESFISFEDFFSKQPWSDLDKTILFKFKAYFLYYHIILNGLSKTVETFHFNMDGSFSHKKLTPKDVVEILEPVVDGINDTMDEVLENQTDAEIMLNFLKSCVNLLVSLITFGYQPNFFKSKTFYLEKLQQIQKNCNDIYQKLSPENQSAALSN